MTRLAIALLALALLAPADAAAQSRLWYQIEVDYTATLDATQTAPGEVVTETGTTSWHAPTSTSVLLRRLRDGGFTFSGTAGGDAVVGSERTHTRVRRGDAFAGACVSSRIETVSARTNAQLSVDPAFSGLRIALLPADGMTRVPAGACRYGDGTATWPETAVKGAVSLISPDLRSDGWEHAVRFRLGRNFGRQRFTRTVEVVTPPGEVTATYRITFTRCPGTKPC